MTDTKIKRRKRATPEPVELVPLEPAAFPSPVDRHRKRMAHVFSKRPAVDAANKARLIALMRAGEMPADACNDVAMPPLSAFMNEYKADQAFAEEYDDAIALAADIAIQDAQAFARDSAATGNIDTMRVADMYAKVTVHALEKLSPRTHGVLVKHAGSDAGPLQVVVTNYSHERAKQ